MRALRKSIYGRHATGSFRARSSSYNVHESTARDSSVYAFRNANVTPVNVGKPRMHRPLSAMSVREVSGNSLRSAQGQGQGQDASNYSLASQLSHCPVSRNPRSRQGLHREGISTREYPLARTESNRSVSLNSRSYSHSAYRLHRSLSPHKLALVVAVPPLDTESVESTTLSILTQQQQQQHKHHLNPHQRHQQQQHNHQNPHQRHQQQQQKQHNHHNPHQRHQQQQHNHHNPHQRHQQQQHHNHHHNPHQRHQQQQHEHRGQNNQENPRPPSPSPSQPRLSLSKFPPQPSAHSADLTEATSPSSQSPPKPSAQSADLTEAISPASQSPPEPPRDAKTRRGPPDRNNQTLQGLKIAVLIFAIAALILVKIAFMICKIAVLIYRIVFRFSTKVIVQITTELRSIHCRWVGKLQGVLTMADRFQRRARDKRRQRSSSSISGRQKSVTSVSRFRKQRCDMALLTSLSQATATSEDLESQILASRLSDLQSRSMTKSQVSSNLSRKEGDQSLKGQVINIRSRTFVVSSNL